MTYAIDTITSAHRSPSLQIRTPSYTKREFTFSRETLGSGYFRPLLLLLKTIEFFGRNPGLEKVRALSIKK